MSTPTLVSSPVMAFVATANPAAAKVFYGDTLGLRLLNEDDFALAFDANGTMLRVQIVETVSPAPYTALGWHVVDAGKVATELTAAGVRMERFAGMNQDARGVWDAPSGARIAWFKDPDGNTLSIAEL
ncbi:MAG: VOC family protein [Gemmatimonadaceae bacterium]